MDCRRRNSFVTCSPSYRLEACHRSPCFSPPSWPSRAPAPASLLQPPPPDPPVGRWVTWPVGGTCHAKTVFAGGASLRVSYNRGGEAARFIVWDPAWRSIEAGRRYRVTVRLGTAFSRTSEESIGARYPSAAGQVEGLFVSAPGGGRAFIDRLGEAPALELQLGETGLGAYPLAGIREVSADLVRCAEEGDARVKAGTAPMTTGSIFRASDYPSVSRSMRRQGTAMIRVAIGADGTVTDCTITASSGFRRLDQQSCAIVRARARYHPPRDAAGNPAATVEDARVSWRFPRR